MPGSEPSTTFFLENKYFLESFWNHFEALFMLSHPSLIIVVERSSPTASPIIQRPTHLLPTLELWQQDAPGLAPELA